MKLLHIISAVVVAGTGVGIAFFMYMANRTNNIDGIYITTRHVVLADWFFTTPAILVQFITGVLLMDKLGYAFTSTWFFWVISLYIFVGLCWLPVVCIQYKLRALALKSAESGRLPAKFKSLMRLWSALGAAAFLSILALFWLMVFKPFPVT